MAKNHVEPDALRRRRFGGTSIALVLGLAVLFVTGPVPKGSPDAHEVSDLGAGNLVHPESSAEAPFQLSIGDDLATLARLPADPTGPELLGQGSFDPLLFGHSYLSAPLASGATEAASEQEFRAEAIFAEGFLSAPVQGSERALQDWLLAAVIPDASPDDLFQPAPLNRLVGHPNEIECLALNIYFEARGESLAGRRAVGEVTMNRVLDPAFPDTVCGVVRQGAMGGKKRGCQFSWWCDGRSDQPVNQTAWDASYDLALAVYWDRSRDLTEGALWFHADYVSPDWAEVFDRGPQIGRHLFYSRPIPRDPTDGAAPLEDVSEQELLEVETLVPMTLGRRPKANPNPASCPGPSSRPQARQRTEELRPALFRGRGSVFLLGQIEELEHDLRRVGAGQHVVIVEDEGRYALDADLARPRVLGTHLVGTLVALQVGLQRGLVETSGHTGL